MRNVHLLTETAIMIALAVVLGFIKFRAPWAYGGSVSLEMVPILLMAFRRGVKAGMVTGLLFGIVDFLINPFFVHPVSILVDYPLAFALVGLAGIVKPDRNRNNLYNGSVIVFGAMVGSGLRFLAHFVSGFVWWGV
ncbi:MAG TPA: energy-coupled thiamine transporter ThiT, partial [Bacillales bacterium]|nr:energy-coupled thiamine transporter ThiT [Bacillales bacterium]